MPAPSLFSPCVSIYLSRFTFPSLPVFFHQYPHHRTPISPVLIFSAPSLPTFLHPPLTASSLHSRFLSPRFHSPPHLNGPLHSPPHLSLFPSTQSLHPLTNTMTTAAPSTPPPPVTSFPAHLHSPTHLDPLPTTLLLSRCGRPSFSFGPVTPSPAPS